MRNSFERLGHHAVVGRHHQNDDVSRLSTAGAHGRKGFMPRGIEERNNAARRLHMISADMLGNATRFTRSDLSAADVVEERGLAMVNVAHDRNNRRTRTSRILFLRFEFAQICFRIIGLSSNRLVAHFLDDEHRRILIEHLVDRNHLTHRHQRLDDFRSLHGHLVGKIGNGNRFRHLHFAHDIFCWLRRGLVLTMTILTAAAAGGTPASRLVAGIAARLDGAM